MRFQRFIIDGYRAINHTEVEVGNSLVPIIGVNESGKTSILQAILAFDRESDRTQKGNHLKYKNRYNRSEDQSAKITAEVVLESKADAEHLAKELKLIAGDELLEKLLKFYKNGTPLHLSRTFPGKRYSIDNIEGLSSTQNNNLAVAVYKALPFILYFDDFSDRVPDKITFKLIKEEPGKYTPVSLNRSTEWHSLIEEIFVRKDSSLSEYLTIRDEKDKKALISDLQDELDAEIVADWKGLIQKYGDEFADESSSLELQMAVTEDDSKIDFEFQVKDRTSRNSRFFNITERSKGFQWFFNFTMKLKFNPKYLVSREGAIYLLDEPGSYLHTSAQEELLLQLKDISKTNAILYCTHSQFLLDPEVINISNIRIARKTSGEIESVPFGSAGITGDQGALTPLYKALHMKAPFIEKAEYQIITEGITDFYFFSLIQKYRNDLIPKGVSFIPGVGAKQLSTLIAIAFSKGYRVLLDSDKEGREAYTEYLKQFGSEEIKNFFKYRSRSADENIVLESHLSPADEKKLLDLTKTADAKSAISVLYYLPDKERRQFIMDLDKDSLGTISITSGVIAAVVS